MAVLLGHNCSVKFIVLHPEQVVTLSACPLTKAEAEKLNTILFLDQRNFKLNLFRTMRVT